MATTPTTPNNKRKIWITVAVIAGCAIIGIIIWKLIAVHI